MKLCSRPEVDSTQFLVESNVVHAELEYKRTQSGWNRQIVKLTVEIPFEELESKIVGKGYDMSEILSILNDMVKVRK